MQPEKLKNTRLQYMPSKYYEDRSLLHTHPYHCSREHHTHNDKHPLQMTTNDYADTIRRTKKMKPRFSDYSNYFMLIFPAGLIGIGCAIISEYLQHPAHQHKELLLSYIIIPLGIFLTYMTLKRLKENISFETIDNPSKLTLPDLEKAITQNFRTANIYTNEEAGIIEIVTKLTGFSWENA